MWHSICRKQMKFWLNCSLNLPQPVTILITLTVYNSPISSCVFTVGSAVCSRVSLVPVFLKKQSLITLSEHSLFKQLLHNSSRDSVPACEICRDVNER